MLKPNQHAVVGNVMNVITVTEVDVEEIICWKDNMFFFPGRGIGENSGSIGGMVWLYGILRECGCKAGEVFVRVDKYAEVGKILDVISDVGDVKFKISGKVVTVYK